MDSINNVSKFGGDAWLELQAFKTRQINRRERLNRHKDLINGIATSSQQSPPGGASLAAQSNHSNNPDDNSNISDVHQQRETQSSRLCLLSNDRAQHKRTYGYRSHNDIENPDCEAADATKFPKGLSPTHLITDINHKSSVDVHIVECLLLLKLCDVALKLPMDSRSLLRAICRVRGLEGTQKSTIENLLEKFAHQELITIEEPSRTLLKHRGRQVVSNSDDQDEEMCIYVISADHTKLVEFDKTIGSSDDIRALLLDARNDELNAEENESLRAEQVVLPAQSIISDSKLLSTNLDKKHHDRGKAKLIYGQKDLPGHTDTSRLKLNKGSIVLNCKDKPSSDDVESLLSLSSTKERESKKLGEELLELLSKPTAKEKNLLERFRSADGYQVQEFCPKGTKDECRRNNRETQACDKLHFKKIIAKHTEESLGDCSFLNTCFHMDSCKYVHYEVDCDDKQQFQDRISKTVLTDRNEKLKSPFLPHPGEQEGIQTNNSPIAIRSGPPNSNPQGKEASHTMIESWQLANSQSGVSKCIFSPEEQARIELRNRKRFKTVLYPPQWIQCDLRYFDMSLLGKFSVVMADPPWDIHMELPYGTMSDDEMRKLNIPALQDEGVIFLWVTGRAMELGRECLALWGYERCDEIIWVKTNQLQRIIRTGRTGHWLNHGKEHCLVGIKGNPSEVNRGLDCDIIVAEVRATSHKPDEIYGIIERLSPGTRKIELFGRAHNVQPNWITLGNQLNGVRLVEPNLIEAFKEHNLPYETSDLTDSNY